MKGFPTELVFVLLFGVALLFNLLMQRAARRQRAEAARDEPAPDEPAHGEIAPPLERVPPAAGLPPRALPVEARRRVEAPALSQAHSQRRYSRQTLLGSKRKVQDAFVVATILGRCRGDEPHEVR